MKEILRRTSTASDAAEIIEGAPNIPLASVTEFILFESWIKEADNLQKIVSLLELLGFSFFERNNQ
jgi:hypothetical protein